MEKKNIPDCVCTRDIKIVRAGKSFSDSKIIIKKVNPNSVADEISQTLRKFGLSPLSPKDTLVFAERVIKHHNETTDEIAYFMGIKKGK